MVKEIRVNGTKIEFEDDELGATRTLKQLSDGTYNTGVLKSKIITATRDMAAASGDISYTGLDFTPTSIICFASVPSAFSYSNGFADSAKTVTCTSAYAAGATTEGAALILLFKDATNSQSAIVKTYDANVGFTLTWTKTLSPTGSAELKFLCFR